MRDHLSGHVGWAWGTLVCKHLDNCDLCIYYTLTNKCDILYLWYILLLYYYYYYGMYYNLAILLSLPYRLAPLCLALSHCDRPLNIY